MCLHQVTYVKVQQTIHLKSEVRSKYTLLGLVGQNIQILSHVYLQIFLTVTETISPVTRVIKYPIYVKSAPLTVFVRKSHIILVCQINQVYAHITYKR